MVAIVLVKLTGWLVLDPLIAIAVAINISLTGLNLFRETASGLMDHSLPEAELQNLEAYLKQRSGNGIDFHALRTRRGRLQAVYLPARARAWRDGASKRGTTTAKPSSRKSLQWWLIRMCLPISSRSKIH